MFPTPGWDGLPLPHTGTDFAWLLASLCIAYALATLVYNAHLHPLAAYPGPLAARSTNLAYWLVTIRGDLLPWIQRIHARHGRVVRLGPNTLSYIDADAWRDIYGHRVGGRRYNPKDALVYQPDLNGRHAFSDRALREQQGLIVRFVDHLVASVRRHAGERVDAVKLLTCTTFDIMGDLTFGEPLGLLEREEYSPWVAAMFSWMKAGDLSRIVLEYPVLGFLAKYLTPESLLEQQRMHFQYSADRVDRRIERGSDQPDIWNLVLRQPEGKRLDRGDMHANGSVFMIAGTETTATLLSGLLYLLCKNPDKMEMLCEEIRGNFKTDEEFTIESLQRLKYMSACLEEALRFYPPLPIGPPREVHPDGSIICGKWVPGKTRLSVAQYAAYHSPENFKDPDSFIPERWFPGTGYDSDKKDAFQPFSFGPRNCLGKNLAYHEMRMILAKLVWNFDFELCPESEGWIRQKIWTLWSKPPLWLKATPLR
ncbi:putative cytochrome p450 protein [Botryosphaeria dothidea]|uniref:Cytochrome p450 protein n=1 Tax=Botryosphaeria dothidea TaxID=55169 RepID=A0A8H4IW02_9PEZI|nr:putative cytochrome p450 protein [Botryosphaeria dothidea]